MLRQPGKYRNIPVEIDGLRFDSGWEGQNYRDLKMRLYAGEIADLQRQVRFELQPGFRDRWKKKHQAISYIADFTFVETTTGQRVALDPKGAVTKEFALKAKLFRFKFPEWRLDVVKKPKKARR